MSAIREIKPLEVHFDDEKEREEFIKWAYQKGKTNKPSLKQMRKEMESIRRIRTQGNRNK
ncbi:hypothetical protein MUB24_04175 [Lederbergia sp. NSJ-179]|uniref:hypothetical protein n=1 Tax=Lederbergia sp. NSJ-179 TaxID=2931402 RepID=UPI001FD0ECC8|nr:hypothetical protein [Lederbergia sp. NSJ-179]MCJ7840120.1 hypothetical protein [Lederbergia sp. NSJ-179]